MNTSSITTDLQQAIQAFVDTGFAGLQLRVNDQHGEWVGSAGVRKLGETAPPSTDGSFWVGSVTKTFTATLVLQLVAEGKLTLDDSVADHLPDLGLDERITVRMLLNHTSGLFNYTGEYYPDGTVVPGIPATGKDWVDNRFLSYQPIELVRLALAKPSRFEPGTDWSYSNTNYTLAVLLIEQLTSTSYAETLDRLIAQPLGLTGTAVPGDLTDLPGEHAHGYYRYQDGDDWKVEDVTRQNLSLLAGAGDLLSTTRDLHVFFSALNSGRLIPTDLLTEMRAGVGPIDYGLGLFVQDLGPAGTVYHHNGSAPGGFGALMYSSPDGTRTMTASITMGDADVDPAQVFPAALAALLNEVFTA
ncbi:serine hydrolase domain-containing protein [Kribbella italica]|uniref:D-alanyl-D-alanine carboxypeptidase n=1 Tax=Kribbella italica TaxID=1540520 RepID=A0A7W9JER1_9ACTN|nr:serine hydrolase domain-containing protein [Kribbella italica]MBB5840400.1 D-alanyl-D-alanine carboxypeptidase [Kribbella italica]